MEWLFVLRLRRVERERCRTFNVGDGYGFLRTGLVHGKGCCSTLAVNGMLSRW